MGDPISSTLERAATQVDLLQPASQADARPQPVSPRIGRYAILRQIGEGGMGVVYAAYDEELERKVAVKLLRQAGPASAERRARILREAQAMAKVSHPNVVSIYEVGETDGQVFIAMEFVEGSTLSRWHGKQHSWDAILRMYVAAGQGLLAAHRAGLVHRELVFLKFPTEKHQHMAAWECSGNV